MNYQAFREEFHRTLREILLPGIQQYLDQRFEAQQQLGRYISALDRKYSDADVIREGFPGIYSAVGDILTEEKRMIDVYLSAVDRLADSFPDETVWFQDEERFTILDDDSLLISAGKSGKQAVRALANSWDKTRTIFNGSENKQNPWKQIVPLRRVLKFHLLDKEVVKDWIQILERIQLKIITDIEEQLVACCKSGENIDLPELAESLQKTLETKKPAFAQRVEDSINKMESDIYGIVEKAGTIERRSNFYNEQRLSSARKDFREDLQKTQDQWLQVQNLLLDRTREVAGFINLAADIKQQADDFISDFDSLFQKNIDQPLCNLAEIIEQAIQQVGWGNSLDEVHDLKTRLAVFVEDELVVPIERLLKNQVLSRKVEHFFEELLLTVGQAPQELFLIFDAELEKEPPIVDQKQMEWRQLVVRALREHLINPMQPNQKKYEEFLTKILNDIREVENIIDVNLESALSAQQEPSDEVKGEHPQKITKEALQRISTQVEDLQSQSTEKGSAVEKEINEGTKNFTQSLLTLLHEGDVKELQLLSAKYRVKETTKDWKMVMDSRLARTQDRLLVWSRFGWKKVKEYGASIRQFAGFKNQKVEEAKRADIATYLSETDQKMKGLPYIYRRLFDFNAVADERFYVPAYESPMTFKKAYEQWQQSFPATFAIVGEKGSGKSSFLNLMMESQLHNARTTQLQLTNTIWSENDLVSQLASEFEISGATDIQGIIEALNNADDRTIVILESIQNCFVRNINGYEAIEKLCYLVSETRDNIFWAISCSRYAWGFLDKTVQISEYFSHITMCDTLDADQIKSVILNRHKSSGYTLYFEPGSDTLRSRNYRKLRDQEEQAQEYLKENYFQRLTELAEGNASVAMIFWIRSIREFDDTYFHIRPLEVVTSIEMLENLSPPVLFTLAALVLHDTLSDEDLAMVLNVTVEESRLLLNRLRSRGLLEEKEGIFAINHLMYRQIVRVLKERNIIHLV